jgi:GSH-dependent disulfide-bond oxidoreductase
MRPAGPAHAQEKKMLKFYYNASPNPAKVALFLEEAGLPYQVVPVDTRKGEQFSDDFIALNPNAKVPAIVDEDVCIFDSSAILLYLAEKTGKFLPSGGLKARGEMLSWMMFVASGVGPYSGQAVHFRHFAPKGLDYAVERYLFEARRHYGILDARLKTRKFVLGDEYTIVDMAAWGWARAIPFVLGEAAWETLPNLKRWFDAINARPAAKRAESIKDKFAFKAEMDADARRFMFQHTEKA